MSRFLQIIGVFLLVVLVALTVSMVMLQSKLNQVLIQVTPPVATPEVATPVAVAPQPAQAQLAVRTTPAPAPRRQVRRAEPAVIYTEPSPVAAAPVISAAPQPPLVLPSSNRPIVAAAPQWEEVTIPSGTVLTVRLINTLHSDQLRAGDHFTAVLDEPITTSSGVVAPRGSTVEGSVVDSRQAGRVSGLSALTLQLDRLALRNGRSVELVTDSLTQQGEASRGTDVAKVGVGSAIGAAIGAIAGGRRGAGIGAATGAGAGAADVLLTRGKPVILAPETRLSFRLRAPVHTEFRPGEVSSDFAEPAAETSSSRGWEEGRPTLRRRQVSQLQ